MAIWSRRFRWSQWWYPEKQWRNLCLDFGASFPPHRITVVSGLTASVRIST
ncbi:uncharacterized protein LACBIDRAFT_310931 [Laccaria bicolor S238N-H82]|uniref:Predicted protein n=1 Tax=Laccaria bicolor (strain S238N-H82 / ATCC MYA-4686) TaxID=486041 RepID=B0E4X7_LACBS|nr:uncharacterized protein LACBIDRAFT_310931 [Laccaria bicolor S238N-H82]EDQ98106.1 predicted protein [Laccaria bicolor S238N-H82]|eukprot:XP_001891246.1 predicted protein [Laccaria bicolor S238N-H82]